MPAWRAMAEAVVRDYPRDEIIQHHAQLQQLLVDMAARSAGGKSASGRYRAYDSAQLQYSTAVAFPTRQFGTRIDAALAAVNSSPITSRDSEGYAPPQPAQVSTPCTYRLDLRVREDNARYTLDELVRDGTSKALRTHAAVPRGQTWNGRPGMDRFLALSIQRVPERVSFAIHAPGA